MKPKIIARRGEMSYLIIEVDDVICAARYNERLHCYVDIIPYGNPVDAIEHCKRGAKGEWFDKIFS